jgi:N-acetylmuramoyl-L-alanine amidase
VRLNPKRHLAVAFLFSTVTFITLACAGLQAAPTNGFSHIALDAGHSIKSQGAISSRGVAEFEFNRQLVLAIDVELKRQNVTTTLIAVEGRTEDLVSRPRKAKEAGAQLFIAVHHDSAKARFHQTWEFEGRPRTFLDDRFRGFSLFVSRNNPQWPLALKCASSIGAQLIAQGFKPSRYHADAVLGESREFADEVNGVHFFDNLAVLRHANMPALLFEAGVIVNRDEEVMLAQPATQQRLAAALVAGAGVCGN